MQPDEGTKMRRYSTVIPLCGLLLLAAATKIADAQASRPASQPSAIVCDSFARDYANNASRQGQVFGGAAKGSLIGLGLGAIAGASGVGAAVGATVGLIGGGARRHQTADRMYTVAYQDCMAGRVR
jgi:hypothetical protein